MPRGAELSATDRARAAWLWSRRDGVIAGLSASAMLGAKWIDAHLPAELIHTNRRPPPLITVHTDELLSGETQAFRGVPITTPARTAFDLGRRLSLECGVQRVDALMNATDIKADDVDAVARSHPGARGLRQLRQTLDLVDGGAESPYESLTRLLLVQAGFPGRRRRSRYSTSTGLSSRESIWAGRITSWASTSRAPITGPVRRPGRGTLSDTTCSPSSAGTTSG